MSAVPIILTVAADGRRLLVSPRRLVFALSRAGGSAVRIQYGRNYVDFDVLESVEHVLALVTGDGRAADSHHEGVCSRTSLFASASASGSPASSHQPGSVTCSRRPAER